MSIRYLSIFRQHLFTKSTSHRIRNPFRRMPEATATREAHLESWFLKQDPMVTAKKTLAVVVLNWKLPKVSLPILEKGTVVFVS